MSKNNTARFESEARNYQQMDLIQCSLLYRSSPGYIILTSQCSVNFKNGPTFLEKSMLQVSTLRFYLTKAVTGAFQNVPLGTNNVLLCSN